MGASARNLVPAAILGLLKSRGVDHFLNNVAQLEDNSPLATVEGRMYVRQIAKFLLEGTTEIDDTEAQAPDDIPEDLDDIPEDMPDGANVEIDEPDSPVENE